MTYEEYLDEVTTLMAEMYKLKDADALFPFAFAAYGWALHIFDRPLTGTCSLVCRGGACLCCMPCLESVRARPLAQGEAGLTMINS